jgi:hypothetical protein
MVFTQLAVDELGQFPGRTNDVKVCAHTFISNLWKGLSDDGIITEV